MRSRTGCPTKVAVPGVPFPSDVHHLADGGRDSDPSATGEYVTSSPRTQANRRSPPRISSRGERLGANRGATVPEGRGPGRSKRSRR